MKRDGIPTATTELDSIFNLEGSIFVRLATSRPLLIKCFAWSRVSRERSFKRLNYKQPVTQPWRVEIGTSVHQCIRLWQSPSEWSRGLSRVIREVQGKTVLLPIDFTCSFLSWLFLSFVLYNSEASTQYLTAEIIQTRRFSYECLDRKQPRSQDLASSWGWKKRGERQIAGAKNTPWIKYE